VGAVLAGPGVPGRRGQGRRQRVGLFGIAVLADHVLAARGVDVYVGQAEHPLDRSLHHPDALGAGQRRDDQLRHQPAVAGVDHLPVEPDCQQLVAQRGHPAGPPGRRRDRYVHQVDTEYPGEYLPGRVTVGDRQQHPGVDVGGPVVVTVPGDIHPRMQPAQRTPQQRPGDADRRDPRPRYGLAAGTEQAVVQPQAGLVLLEPEVPLVEDPADRYLEHPDHGRQHAADRHERGEVLFLRLERQRDERQRQAERDRERVRGEQLRHENLAVADPVDHVLALPAG